MVCISVVCHLCVCGITQHFLLRSDDVSNIPVDPCDKNVVVSALKQKRSVV